MTSPAEPTCLTFETSALAAALREVRGAVERRNTIPVLSNVLIEADPTGIVTLTATDLDVMVSRTVPATVTRAVRFTVPAHRLADVVGAFAPGGQTAIEYEGSGAIVKSGRARLRFSTLPATDFPKIAQPEVIARFTIDPKALSRGIGAVRHAISTEEARYYLNGIYWHVSDGKLRYVATDGHRLARYVDDLPLGAEGMPAVILRTRCIELARAAAEARSGDVDVSVSRTKVTMATGDFTIVAKTVDGTYPDYTRVIPSNIPNKAQVDRDELDGALSRVAVASSDKTRIVKLDFERNVVRASITSPEHGAAVDEAGCELTGHPMSIGFNTRYLRDALAVIDVDQVEIGMGSAADAALLTSPKASGLSLVLMPVRV